jgi:hypothetical protein
MNEWTHILNPVSFYWSMRGVLIMLNRVSRKMRESVGPETLRKIAVSDLFAGSAKPVTIQ